MSLVWAALCDIHSLFIASCIPTYCIQWNKCEKCFIIFVTSRLSLSLRDTRSQQIFFSFRLIIQWNKFCDLLVFIVASTDRPTKCLCVYPVCTLFAFKFSTHTKNNCKIKVLSWVNIQLEIKLQQRSCKNFVKFGLLPLNISFEPTHTTPKWSKCQKSYSPIRTTLPYI